MILLAFGAVEVSGASTDVSILRRVGIVTGSIVQARLEKVAWSIGDIVKSARSSRTGPRRGEKGCSRSDGVRGIFSANH